MTDLIEIKKISAIAYEFLREFTPDEYADGRYEMLNEAYVNIETYETKKRENAYFESHKKYIDIQFMIEGEEIVEVVPIQELTVRSPYDSEKDIVFYNNDVIGNRKILRTGEFLVFYPSDGHMPCIGTNESRINRKAVIKIPV